MSESVMVSEKKGYLLILALRGQFDAGSLSKLEVKTKRLAERECADLVFDLAGTSFVSLSVISFIMSCAGILIQHGKKVKMCGVPEWLGQVLDKSDVSQYIEFYDDQFGALLSFGSKRWSGLGVYERRSGINLREHTLPFKEFERRDEKRRDFRSARGRQEPEERRQSKVRW